MDTGRVRDLQQKKDKKMNTIKRISKTEATEFIPNKNYFKKGYRTFFGSTLIKDDIFSIGEVGAGVYEDRIVSGIDGKKFEKKVLKLFFNNNIITVNEVSAEQLKTIKKLLKKAYDIEEQLLLAYIKNGESLISTLDSDALFY